MQLFWISRPHSEELRVWVFLPAASPTASLASQLVLERCRFPASWLCRGVSDRLAFRSPDQALSCGGSHLVMLAPQSRVLPGQVSSTPFGGHKSEGRFGAWPAFALACSGPSDFFFPPTVVCAGASVSHHSSFGRFQALSPRRAASGAFCPERWEGTMPFKKGVLGPGWV